MKEIFVRMRIRHAEDQFTMEVPKDASFEEIESQVEEHLEDFVRNNVHAQQSWTYSK